MADYDYQDDDYEDEPQERQAKPGADLRKLLRQREKELKETQAKLAELEGSTKKRTAQEVLTERGANPKFGRFLVSDGVDPADRIAVDRWVSENADLLGVEVVTDAPLSDDEAEAAVRQERITRPRGQSGDSAAQALKAIQKFGSGDRDEFEKWLASQGTLPGA